MGPGEAVNAKVNELDASLRDVMAQVEAILRRDRTIARGMLRLRRGDGAVATKDRVKVIQQNRDLRSAADALD